MSRQRSTSFSQIIFILIFFMGSSPTRVWTTTWQSWLQKLAALTVLYPSHFHFNFFNQDCCLLSTLSFPPTLSWMISWINKYLSFFTHLPGGYSLHILRKFMNEWLYYIQFIHTSTFICNQTWALSFPGYVIQH